LLFSVCRGIVRGTGGAIDAPVNSHVVSGVRKIQATFPDGRSLTAPLGALLALPGHPVADALAVRVTCPKMLGRSVHSMRATVLKPIRMTRSSPADQRRQGRLGRCRIRRRQFSEVATARLATRMATTRTVTGGIGFSPGTRNNVPALSMSA